MESEIRRMLVEFIKEMELENWFGKEREIVSRFVFSKLLRNIGCCPEFNSQEQVGIEVRVKQVQAGKTEVCKDLVIWRYPNQTVWNSPEPPLCIIEWKHRNKKPFKDDVDWLCKYTSKFPDCAGIAVNVENEGRYALQAVLVKNGAVYDPSWI